MKDTVIKGDGTSRTLKAPARMPEAFEEWRRQLLAGNATMDIGLNSDGCTVVGTAMSKANLLSDTTKAALELSQSDPTVNDALYALSQKGSPAEVRVIADTGSTVTMSRGDVYKRQVSIASAVALNWNAMEEAISSPLSRISVIVGTAMLALGAILAFSGGSIPLGIALMALGATSIASAVALRCV